VTVTALPTKPALFAGFLLLGAHLPAFAQEYVDVEAERRAASENLNAPVTVVDDEVSVYSGIRPYSGSTTVASPPADTNSGDPAVASDPGSLLLRVQQLEADVRRLNGLLEEATQALVRLEAQSLERYVDLDRRMAAGGSAVGTAVAGDATSSLQPAPAGAGIEPVPASVANPQIGEEAAYRAAYELVREKAFDDAVTAFKAFLADYPFGRYAPNAHYWLGELYLVLDPPDPELARQSFKILLDQYPADPKVPDALYKLGRVQFIKGNRQRSREYLDEVIREYPSHAAAQLARQFLLENF
jgi:tol-pal system protein YbgF